MVISTIAHAIEDSLCLARRTALMLLAAGLVLSACQSEELIQPGDTVDEAFEKAMTLYENEDYSQAADAFETVLSIARGTEFAEPSQFYLAQSYFHEGRYEIAASEFNRHSSTYPRSERVEDSRFMEALSYYHLSPRFRLDQTHTRRAIERFRLFIDRHPDSDLVVSANEHIDELRGKLARKQFEAAEFYMTVERYQAAIKYYEITLDEYPETEWAERALANKVQAQVLYAENSVQERQEERFEDAIQAYEQYLQIFPNGENRQRVEDYYQRAINGLENVQPASNTE